MSFSACVEIVRRGDPDRFLASMAAPEWARPALFSVYALNVETARVAWSVEEPAVAQVRLQWWRDALADFANQDQTRSHEVMETLTDVLDATSVEFLDALIEARQRDIERHSFETEDELSDFLDQTAGNLTMATARATGVIGFESAIRQIAWASGLANLFLASPELQAKGYDPFPDSTPDALRNLAGQGLARIHRARPPIHAKPALLATWRAHRILNAAYRWPERVLSGELGGPEFMRRATLVWKTYMD